ncbi:MAG: hypothetical protein IV094_21925 [Vitreoscilla sp.]|nr:hypothetical protein [Vitreoscilla sp.]
MSKFQRSLALVAASVAVGSANAAIDLAPITAAQTDAMSVVAALLAMGIAVWGGLYVRNKFFR